MKKLVAILIFGLIGWTSLYDLTNGTLSLILAPKPLPVAAQTTTAKATPLPKSTSIVVKPGDTVLSIEEKLNPKQTLSIATVLSDFKKLNPAENPNHIQIGQHYKFKIYSSGN
ncbi:MAG TPA: LysM domain-containing protein [Candidatus Angelobacter sp.]|nr:LysM domain-containing protein [Candidatus Angelobacter sp.]